MKIRLQITAVGPHHEIVENLLADSIIQTPEQLRTRRPMEQTFEKEGKRLFVMIYSAPGLYGAPGPNLWHYHGYPLDADGLADVSPSTRFEGYINIIPAAW